jgi:hypothetical protein
MAAQFSPSKQCADLGAMLADPNDYLDTQDVAGTSFEGTDVCLN